MHEITDVIQSKIMPHYIKFPVTQDEQNRIKNRFFRATGFPGVIVAIDCTHVKIKKPSQKVEHCYINRKGYFSKNVQLICDYELNTRILEVLARFAGGSHDAFIWEASKANAFLENQYLRQRSGGWLIGDSGYPLQSWLITPFERPSNVAEENYNQHHSQARNCVERLNGVLKKVFDSLSRDRGLLLDPEFAGAVSYKCLLHTEQFPKSIQFASSFN